MTGGRLGEGRRNTNSFAVPPTTFSSERLARDAAFARFRRRLESIRRVGWALNRERTERGVAALGMAVRDDEDTVVAAVSNFVPSHHTALLDSPEIHAALGQVCRDSLRIR